MSSSLPPDPYKVLGVTRDAQIAEIRSAHRKLVLKCHPDKVQDATLKAQKQDEFQKVQQAYELLSDEKERQKYDDQVKLAELREQMRKANLSTPRSAAKYTEYEIRTPEPRPSSYKASATATPGSSNKTYTTYSRSWEDDEVSSGPRFFEPGSRSSRREPSYTDSRSKRESERERERERERDRERDRRARKVEKEEAARRAEKEAKDARRAEKKQKEKQRDKEIKRESEEKKKHTRPGPYIEDYSDEAPPPKSEKKKTSGKKDKYDEKRDRSVHREESAEKIPVRAFAEFATTPFEPARTIPIQVDTQYTDQKLSNAAFYIEAARAKESGPKRSVIYHTRLAAQPPAAPTPPPAQNQSSPFPVPDDDDVRRSSARSRRDSTESNRLSREKSYRKSSREPLDEPIILGASPRHAAHPAMSGSPPHLTRISSMPVDPGFARTAPGIARAQTYNFGEGSDPRGRGRSRLQPQMEEDIDSDDVQEYRARERKHRNSRRTITPEPQTFMDSPPRYQQAYEGRQPSYTRRGDPEADRYAYYSSSHERPSMPVRESSYSTSTSSAQFPKYKVSKSYGLEDAQYSTHHYQKPREEYSAFA